MSYDMDPTQLFKIGNACIKICSQCIKIGKACNVILNRLVLALCDNFRHCEIFCRIFFGAPTSVRQLLLSARAINYYACGKFMTPADILLRLWILI